MSLVLAQLKRYLAGQDMQVGVVKIKIFNLTGVEVRMIEKIPNYMYNMS